MARQTNRPAATLEHQPAADAEIGSISADGLEKLPEFPSREEHLADLDAGDDALNGQHLVRPSEMCGTLAGNGPYAGRRCTYAEHGPNEPHSWEVSTEPLAEQPGHVYDDAAQPTLPGTPEPEQNEWSVPTEAAFGKKGLLRAPGLADIAERLIEGDVGLEHLQDADVRYHWRRRGGTRGGSPVYYHVKRPDLYDNLHTGGAVVFFVDLSADHIRDARFTQQQIEACLHEVLCMTERDPDDHDAYRIIPPDFSGSIRTLDKFGAWKPELRELRAHMVATPLEEAINQADTEDGDDGEDDSE